MLARCHAEMHIATQERQEKKRMLITREKRRPIAISKFNLLLQILQSQRPSIFTI